MMDMIEQMIQEENGQMTFLPMNMNSQNMVVQANNFILGRQDLTLNEAKLVRLAIMQIVANDIEFQAYSVSPSEFAAIVGIDDSNVYRTARAMCASIMSKYIEIENKNGAWAMYSWTSLCKYDPETNLIQIKLNAELKPFLLNLVRTGYYTQYAIEYAVAFKSINTMRVFELFMEKLLSKKIPADGENIYVSVEDIRRVCMSEEKLGKEKLKKLQAEGKLDFSNEKCNYFKRNGVVYKKLYTRASHVKEALFKRSIAEIESTTPYVFEYSDVKEGRGIVGFNVNINLIYHKKKAVAGKIKVIS